MVAMSETQFNAVARVAEMCHMTELPPGLTH